MPQTERTAAYVRVSSASQTARMQVEAIERASAARGHAIAHWYNEKKSAKTLARPELERLREDARAGRLGRLYVYRLDRLSRSGIKDTLGLVDELRAHGCEIVSLSDGFDVCGPASEIILAVLAWAAKMERLAIDERLAEARERARARGQRWGRPPRMSEAEVTRARALRNEGRSIRAIAQVMQVPRPTIARALAAPPKPPSRKAPRKPLAKTTGKRRTLPGPSR